MLVIKNLENVHIDIGAHSGAHCVPYAYNNPDKLVFAFEPLMSVLPVLRENTKRYKNIIVVPKAVDVKNGKAMFYEGLDKETSSLLPFVKENVVKWEISKGSPNRLSNTSSYYVETIRLDAFMEENNINSIEYLKVDAQGHDLAVIKSLGTSISKVKQIKAEVQITDFKIYKNSSTRAELVDYLKSNNFRIVNETEQSLGQEVNILFLRC